MNNQSKHTWQAGFTLIEVMISMAIFSIVVTIGIGAVLDTIAQHRRSEEVRSVMDNLNFVMEDIVRNLHNASTLHCYLPSEAAYVTTPITPQSCPTGSNKITFLNQTGTKNITYTITSPIDPAPDKVFKQEDDIGTGVVTAGTPKKITPPNVKMDFATSGFTVRGAEPASTGDQAQPVVIIRLAGTVTYKTYTSKFALETSVVLRTLDI